MIKGRYLTIVPVSFWQKVKNLFLYDVRYSVDCRISTKSTFLDDYKYQFKYVIGKRALSGRDTPIKIEFILNKHSNVDADTKPLKQFINVLLLSRAKDVISCPFTYNDAIIDKFFVEIAGEYWSIEALASAINAVINHFKYYKDIVEDEFTLYEEN